jgi:hypothetical protein
MPAFDGGHSCATVCDAGFEVILNAVPQARRTSTFTYEVKGRINETPTFYFNGDFCMATGCRLHHATDETPGALSNW